MSGEKFEIHSTKVPPHLLKYMGSKREILNFVVDSITKLESSSGWLCDLFSGTGIVGGVLKNNYKIHSNDIQAYSSILSSTYLLNLKGKISNNSLLEIKERTSSLVTEFKEQYNQFAFDYSNIQSFEEFQSVENKQKELINFKFDIGFHLFTKNYSGTYWSCEQCIWIDSIRAVADQYINKPEYYPILSSLIFAMSYVSQSTGHYAQYREPTKENMNDILTYRKKEIWPYFAKKFQELIENVNGIEMDFKVTTLDYIDCLRIIEPNSIVYADPPYQSVHYSRFYHTLETLVKYDYPKIDFRGRYRNERHQSPFCKRSSVQKAFKLLFEGVDYRKSHLVLSYADTAIIDMTTLLKISRGSLKNYEVNVYNKDHIHSKMGRSDKKDQEVTEFSLIFKRK